MSGQGPRRRRIEPRPSRTQRQVCEIAGRYYFMSPEQAYWVSIMPRRKHRTWLGRNWRRAIPLVVDPLTMSACRKSGSPWLTG